MPVIVNGVEITDDAVFAEMQYHPASSAEEAIQLAAEALTIRELLLQEAAHLGISAPDTTATAETQEEYVISRLLEQEVLIPKADDIICQRYYDQNQKKFCDTSGKIVPFQYVKETISAYLEEVSWQTAMRQYVQILVGRATIAGLQLQGSDSPLVQ